MSPRIEDAGALLYLPDPAGRWSSVRMAYHLRAPYPDLDFARTGDGWGYWLPRPPVDRLEYRIECTEADGTAATLLDETNPRRTPGVFGDHSVLEFPSYTPPPWLGWPAPDGLRTDLVLVSGPGMRRDLPVTVVTPAGLSDSDPAPLLLVHDGPEMDRFAGVTRYSAAMVAAGMLPPHRVGLLAPLDRDAWYSASPAYARALTRNAVPALRAAVPTTGRPVLAGASLGALAALHAEWTTPGTFGGLFLASGSFFQMRFDSQEASHERFYRISSTVERIVDSPRSPTDAPIAMVCGTGEENWDNNAAMARALTRMGRRVGVIPFRDGHTWVGWRDALHPFLTTLLTTVWGTADEH